LSNSKSKAPDPLARSALKDPSVLKVSQDPREPSGRRAQSDLRVLRVRGDRQARTALWGSKAPLALRVLPVPLVRKVIPVLSVQSEQMAHRDPLVVSALPVLQDRLARWDLLAVHRTVRRDLLVRLVLRARLGHRATLVRRVLQVRLELMVSKVRSVLRDQLATLAPLE